MFTTAKGRLTRMTAVSSAVIPDAIGPALVPGSEIDRESPASIKPHGIVVCLRVDRFAVRDLHNTFQEGRSEPTSLQVFSDRDVLDRHRFGGQVDSYESRKSAVLLMAADSELRELFAGDSAEFGLRLLDREPKQMPEVRCREVLFRQVANHANNYASATTAQARDISVASSLSCAAP